ncbi:MAG: diguanylate cyclase, partial [Gammaproteobacteria bacterium]|nr:diguanylate cyclase [Gammaproteobacteria bacterium]
RRSGTAYHESVTISVGVAVLEDNSETPFEDADRALYSAKNAGRDRVHSSRDVTVNVASVVSIKTPAS